jgi:hypothetical protein
LTEEEIEATLKPNEMMQRRRRLFSLQTLQENTEGEKVKENEKQRKTEKKGDNKKNMEDMDDDKEDKVEEEDEEEGDAEEDSNNKKRKNPATLENTSVPKKQKKEKKEDSLIKCPGINCPYVTNASKKFTLTRHLKNATETEETSFLNGLWPINKPRMHTREIMDPWLTTNVNPKYISHKKRVLEQVRLGKEDWFRENLIAFANAQPYPTYILLFLLLMLL